MTIGLRIRNSSGAVDLDTSIRTPRHLITLTLTVLSGSYIIDELAKGGTPFYQYFYMGVKDNPPGATITFTGNRVNWVIEQAYEDGGWTTYLPYRLVVGVY